MKKSNGAAFLPIGVGTGIAIGTALGLALDNLALGIALGVAIGSGLGVALTGASQAKRNKDADSGPIHTDSAGPDGGEGSGGGD